MRGSSGEHKSVGILWWSAGILWWYSTRDTIITVQTPLVIFSINRSERHSNRKIFALHAPKGVGYAPLDQGGDFSYTQHTSPGAVANQGFGRFGPGRVLWRLVRFGNFSGWRRALPAGAPPAAVFGRFVCFGV